MARSLIVKTGWAVAALAALGTVAFAARTSLITGATDAAPQITTRPAQPVRVSRVSLVTPDAVQTYTGTLRPQHEAGLGFRLPGQLVARLVDVGDRVTAGQVLARLDDTDARLELETATAEQLAARTDQTRAKAELSRSTRLFAEGHVAKAALDAATSAAAEAQSRSDRADRAQHLAANRLSYTVLRAESDGIVTATFAEAGQVVASGQAVVSVAVIGKVDVVFALPEQRRTALQIAQGSAEIWGDGGHPYALKLRDISPDVDPATRTYRVRMTLTAPDADAALGRTVTVTLATAGDAPLAILPLASVISDGHGAAVWRLAADRVDRVPVQVVAVEGQTARLRGLADGDLVVSLGAAKIDAARPVRVVETTPGTEGF